MIFLIILNLSGSSPMTGLILIATGLYFFFVERCIGVMDGLVLSDPLFMNSKVLVSDSSSRVWMIGDIVSLSVSWLLHFMLFVDGWSSISEIVAINELGYLR